jgi:hypothetical protein
LKKFDQVSELISENLLHLTKQENELFEQRKENLHKMDYWTIFIQFKKCFPNEDDDDSRPQQEMIYKILEYEKNKLLKQKMCFIMGIPINY